MIDAPDISLTPRYGCLTAVNNFTDVKCTDFRDLYCRMGQPREIPSTHHDLTSIFQYGWRSYET